MRTLNRTIYYKDREAIKVFLLAGSRLSNDEYEEALSVEKEHWNTNIEARKKVSDAKLKWKKQYE